MSLTKNQLRVLAGMPTVNEYEEQKQALAEQQPAKKITESGTYDGSADFAADLDDATSHLDKFGKLTASVEFGKWLSSTDTNFNTSVVEKMQKVNEAFKNLYDAWNDLQEELDNAA